MTTIHTVNPAHSLAHKNSSLTCRRLSPSVSLSISHLPICLSVHHLPISINATSGIPTSTPMPSPVNGKYTISEREVSPDTWMWGFFTAVISMLIEHYVVDLLWALSWYIVSKNVKWYIKKWIACRTMYKYTLYNEQRSVHECYIRMVMQQICCI